LKIVRGSLLVALLVARLSTSDAIDAVGEGASTQGGNAPEVQTAAAPIAVSLAARSIQPGELVVVTVTARADVNRMQVSAFGHPVPVAAVAPRTWRALVGIDLDVVPGRYLVSVTARSGERDVDASQGLDVKTRRFATRTLRVAEAFVNPPEEALARIAREAAALEHLWQESAAEPLWSGPFARPVPDRATSSFGTRSIYNGEARSPHGGTDFLSPAGRPVNAPNGGRVVLAGELYFTGNTVVIDHGVGLMSLFAHLSSIAVREGDTVTRGTLVGQVGATGRVTGPHLHWAVRASGARVDPLALLAVLGGK
jgi:murein DD-endopeptidase MepM/ murein hydrolase activator NlpD